MQVNQLGRSGLYVSELSLGTMTFGMPQWGCDEPTSIALIDRYLDAGGNVIDTADVYGADGASETICGRALEHKRAQVVLATKVGMAAGPGLNERGASRRHIVASCEASLARLQTDYIDLYWVHIDDGRTPLEETVAALDDLVRAGKVLYVGASNFHAYRLMKALAISEELDAARFVALQGQYNLIVRHLEREHLPLLEEEGLGFVSWSPLAAGMLTGKITQEDQSAETRLADRDNNLTVMYKNPYGFEIAEVVKRLADQVGCSPAQLALAWQRTRPVTSVIIGARTMAQLDDNLASLDLVIPPEVLTELEEATRLRPEYPGMMIDVIRQMMWGHQRLGQAFDTPRR